MELTADEPKKTRHPFSNRTDGRDEWLTPPEIIKALGPFDLDPCAPIERPWPMAEKHFTILDNGLTKEWTGCVWLNPPYGDETGKWLNCLAAHGNGIALIFARTETTNFFKHVWPKASAIVFIEGRINFYRVTGRRAKKNSGAPNCLIAYGIESAWRLARAVSSKQIKGFYIRIR